VRAGLQITRPYAVHVASIFPVACALVATPRGEERRKRQTREEIREGIADVRKVCGRREGAKKEARTTAKEEERKTKERERAGCGNGAVSHGIRAAIVLAELPFLRLYGRRAEFAASRI